MKASLSESIIIYCFAYFIISDVTELIISKAISTIYVDLTIFHISIIATYFRDNPSVLNCIFLKSDALQVLN